MDVRKNKIEPLSVLNARYRNMEEREALLVKEINDKQEELKQVRRVMDGINKSRKRLLSGNIEITDHAILRYQERVEFIPPDEIKAKLLNEKFTELVNTLGPDGVYPVFDNIIAKVANRKIITITVL